MLLFRAVRTNPPTVRDFRCPASAGRAIPSPELERTFLSVSAFLTPAAVAAKNQQVNGRLGGFVATLDIPESVDRTVGGDHVDLHGTTPEQLLAYVTTVSLMPAVP